MSNAIFEMPCPQNELANYGPGSRESQPKAALRN